VPDHHERDGGASVVLRAVPETLAAVPFAEGIEPVAVPAGRYVPARDLAVVTSYFNSHNYASKRRGFELFRRSMERSGVPLFIGECAFGEEPFELEPSASVFQFRGRDVMWQKERLLNLAIDRVPDRYTKIAWVDADVLFTNPRWIVEASELLDELRAVQPFSHAVRLRPGETSDFGGGERSRGFGFTRSALPALSRLRYHIHGHTGFAWAADRQLLSDIALYDAAIAGTGDHLMAHAFSGDFGSPCLPVVFGGSSGFLEHYRGWAERAWSHVRGRVGHVGGAVLHLWHGETANRGYARRYRQLTRLGYDPSVHLRAQPGALWEWADAGSELSAWTIRYFGDRREDSAGALAVR
jgi:hypothetical protein